MNEIVWGILGVAKINNSIIPAIKKSKNGRLLAIASRNLERAKIFAENFGIPKAYGSYNDLILDPEINVVYIPLPNDIHKEWTLKAVKNKKHVLCEKPISLGVEDTEEMFKESKKNNVILMEAFMYRFNPCIDYLKEFISKESIGEVKFIEFNLSHDLTKYLKNQKNFRLTYPSLKGGGSLFDLGVYGLSICNVLLGANPDQILSAIAETSGIDVDHTFMATLKYKKDIIVNLTCSFQFTGNHIYISGVKGVIKVSNIISSKEIIIEILDSNYSIIKRDKLDAFDNYLAEINHLNDCILYKKEPLITEKDSVDIMKIVQDLFENSGLKF